MGWQGNIWAHKKWKKAKGQFSSLELTMKLPMHVKQMPNKKRKEVANFIDTIPGEAFYMFFDLSI